jgi:hypothetical protein
MFHQISFILVPSIALPFSYMHICALKFYSISDARPPSIFACAEAEMIGRHLVKASGLVEAALINHLPYPSFYRYHQEHGEFFDTTNPCSTRIARNVCRNSQRPSASAPRVLAQFVLSQVKSLRHLEVE